MKLGAPVGAVLLLVCLLAPPPTRALEVREASSGHRDGVKQNLRSRREEGTGVLKLAAFNIQIFGTTKFGMPAVVDILSRVCSKLQS